MDHNFWGNLSLIAVYLCCLVKIKPWIPRHLMHTSHDCHIWSMMISVQWILLFLGVFMNYQYQYNHQSSGDYWYMSVLTSEQIFRCIDISRILKTFRHLGYKTLQAFSSTNKIHPINDQISLFHLIVECVQFVCTFHGVIGLTDPIVSRVIYIGLYKPAVLYLVQLENI